MKSRSLLGLAGGLVMVILGPTAAPSAQLLGLGDEIRADCSNVTQGDVVDSSIAIVCGMSPAEFAENMRLALSPLESDKQELFRRLDDLLPESSKLRVGAIRSFFLTLGEAEVSPERLQDRFAEIASRHLALLEEIRRFRVRDPKVQALKDEAAAALDGDDPDHDRARAKLEEARQLVRAKREAAARLLAEQRREEAALVSAQAGVEASRLRYAAAAMLHEEAASVLPEGDVAKRRAELMAAAGGWYNQGDEFGDNDALHRSIAVWSEVLAQLSRADVPLDWAMTQNNLGNALWTLGERENGTARLEKAVAAYQAALEEMTRERVPLQWATTQNNLGNALTRLGERERGTARLEEAVAAYQAALEERTRERVPLQWAGTQDNLGTALWVLGERSHDIEALQDAHTAVGNAFQVVVVEANYAQNEAYFHGRLQDLEQAIMAVKEARAKR